jgi:hypothetical protein
MPRKEARSREQRLQYVADLVVQTASRYEIPVHEVGIPSLSISNECDSHGRRISCLGCYFNRCQICGKALRGLTLWTGRCDEHQAVPESADHVAEVKALINDQTPRQKAVARRISEPPLPVAQAVMMEAPPQINITIAPSLIVETTRVRRVGEASASRFEITITVALSGRQE